jgi:hypothetical protein
MNSRVPALGMLKMGMQQAHGIHCHGGLILQSVRPSCQSVVLLFNNHQNHTSQLIFCTRSSRKGLNVHVTNAPTPRWAVREEMIRFVVVRTCLVLVARRGRTSLQPVLVPQAGTGYLTAMRLPNATPARPCRLIYCPAQPHGHVTTLSCSVCAITWQG